MIDSVLLNSMDNYTPTELINSSFCEWARGWYWRGIIGKRLRLLE